MSKVSHVKGPEKEGQREQVRYPTHISYVEGLDEITRGDSSNTDYALEVATAAQTKATNAESIANTAKTVAENAESIANIARAKAEEARNATENGFAITETEPDNDAYWLHIEEVEDE